MDRVTFDHTKIGANISVTSLSTVCMLLGPYRNFTTLTSSVLALHPLISVFNHGGERVFGRPDIDFTNGYTNQKFDAFCQFALEAAKSGKKGSYGGSITHSGAFHRNENIKEKYLELFEHGKDQAPKCLLWKEPHRLLYHLRANDFDFENLFSQNQKIRFLIPVRNIYDCACSNFITGHFTIGFQGLRNDSTFISGTMGQREKLVYCDDGQSRILGVVDMLLKDLWFLNKLNNMFPGKFLFYFQHNEPKQIFDNILEFLNLGADKGFIHSQFKIRPIKYALSENMRSEILRKIDTYFSDEVEMHFNLAKFF